MGRRGINWGMGATAPEPEDDLEDEEFSEGKARESNKLKAMAILRQKKSTPKQRAWAKEVLDKKNRDTQGIPSYEASGGSIKKNYAYGGRVAKYSMEKS